MADEDSDIPPPISVVTRSVKIKMKEDQPQTVTLCTVDTQTDYRDSETQTEPYTPKYVAKPTTPPELLTLASLKTGRGLPPGLSEVERLEFARRRKAMEAMMPPFNDRSQLPKRERMMLAIEKERWDYRERDIQRQHDLRLDQLSQHLWQREKRQQEVTDNRLLKRFSQRQREKEEKIQKLYKEYRTSIRRLTESDRNVGGVLQTRKIMKEYSAYAKRVFGPRQHKGRAPDLDSLLDAVKNKYLSTYEGLMELVDSIPPTVTDLCINAPKPKSFKGFIKRTDRQEMKLMKIHQALKAEKLKVEDKPYRFLHRLTKPRFPVSLASQLSEEDEDDLPVIFLKKALKGTAVMTLVFEGKEKRLELIQELRSTHALQLEEQELQRAEKQATLALQRQRELNNHKTSMATGYQWGMVGKVVADMLETLSK